MKKKIIQKTIFIIFDIIIINSVFILSFYIRFSGSIPSYNFMAYLRSWHVITSIFILIFYFSKIYSREESSIYFFLDLFHSISFSYLIIIVLYYILRETIGSFPTTVFLLSWIFNIFFLSLIRAVTFRIAFKKNVLIIGRDKNAKTAADLVKRNTYNYTVSINKNTDINNIIKKIIQKKILIVIITENIRPAKQFYILLDKLSGLGTRILFDIKITDLPMVRTKIFNLHSMIFYEILWGKPDIFNLFLKRSFDIIISFFLLLLLIPFFLLIALIIIINSKGPVFFKQERIGKDYKKFIIYKFRTMVPDAEKKIGPVWAGIKDKRITKPGRILRKFGIDELPQLWNILKGNMSIVGPRPERKYFIEKYPVLLGRRLSVRPGITGLAQINSSGLNPAEKTKYDVVYVENQAFLLDITIIKKTLYLLIKRLYNE